MGSPMETKKHRNFAKRKGGKVDAYNNISSYSTGKVVALQLISAASIVAGLWIVPPLVGVNLIQQPVDTIGIFVGLTLPVSVATFSLVPLKPRNSLVPVWWAIIRALLSLPVGRFFTLFSSPLRSFFLASRTVMCQQARWLARLGCDCNRPYVFLFIAGVVVAAFIAFMFGAPWPFQYTQKTLYWATLMSILVVVPAAAVLGASWPSWHRLFACTAPIGPLEIAICIPAHGAAIGAWVGAWLMPLDWERPWQEWPVCCTYGAVGGYLVGLVGSLVWTYCNSGHFIDIDTKQD